MCTFGAGGAGQLGHNSTRNELTPRVVAELWGARVSQVACGRWENANNTPSKVKALGRITLCLSRSALSEYCPLFTCKLLSCHIHRKQNPQPMPSGAILLAVPKGLIFVSFLKK